jgi:hypothetical protein
VAAVCGGTASRGTIAAFGSGGRPWAQTQVQSVDASKLQ